MSIYIVSAEMIYDEITFIIGVYDTLDKAINCAHDFYKKMISCAGKIFCNIQQTIINSSIEKTNNCILYQTDDFCINLSHDKSCNNLKTT